MWSWPANERTTLDAPTRSSWSAVERALEATEQTEPFRGLTLLATGLRSIYVGLVTSRIPIPTRLDEDEIAALDELVDAGLANNRAEAIRLSIRRMKESFDRARIGDQIVTGYMAMPQTKEELDAARVGAVALLDAESWAEYESTPE